MYVFTVNDDLMKCKKRDLMIFTSHANKMLMLMVQAQKEK